MEKMWNEKFCYWIFPVFGFISFLFLVACTAVTYQLGMSLSLLFFIMSFISDLLMTEIIKKQRG